MSIETFNEFQEGKSKWVERKEMESKDKIKISSELLNEMDSIAIQLGKEDSLKRIRDVCLWTQSRLLPMVAMRDEV